MTKQKHVISKKAYWGAAERRGCSQAFCWWSTEMNNQSWVSRSVCSHLPVSPAALYSCHSTAAHWAHPNLPPEVWIIWPFALSQLLCTFTLLRNFERTAHTSEYTGAHHRRNTIIYEEKFRKRFVMLNAGTAAVASGLWPSLPFCQKSSAELLII